MPSHELEDDSSSYSEIIAKISLKNHSLGSLPMRWGIALEGNCLSA